MPRVHLPALLLLLAGVAATVRAASVSVGDEAPAFTLADRDGGRVALAELRGHVVCLDFWATWCASCKAALPELDAMARRAGYEDVRFVAVNIDRDHALAAKFLAQHLPSPVLTMLHDPGGSVLARYGAGGMPALYLIDRDGVVRHVESGYTTEALPRVERTLSSMRAPR